MLVQVGKIAIGFHNLQNYYRHLIFHEIGKHNFKITFIQKIKERYANFTTKQPIKKSLKSGLPLVFTDSAHSLNSSLDNLSKNVGTNVFYCVS